VKQETVPVVAKVDDSAARRAAEEEAAARKHAEADAAKKFPSAPGISALEEEANRLSGTKVPSERLEEVFGNRLSLPSLVERNLTFN
jgi:hypothetical protein